jgi:hypothetical protein
MKASEIPVFLFFVTGYLDMILQALASFKFLKGRGHFTHNLQRKRVELLVTVLLIFLASHHLFH